MPRSIRVQLLLLEISSLLLLLIVGLAAIEQVRRLSMDSARQYALAAGNQVKSGVETILDNVRVTANSFCYSAPVQELLSTKETDKLRLAELYRGFSSSVSYAINTNSNIVDICLIPMKRAPYVFGAQAPKVLPLALERYQDAGGSGAMFTGFLGEEGGSEYYAYLLPVNRAAPGEGFSRQAGLCLVLCRTSAVLDAMQSAAWDNARVVMAYDGGEKRLSVRGAPAFPSQGAEEYRYKIDSVDWELVQTVALGAAFAGNRSAETLITSFLIIAALGIGASVCFTYRNISLPITQIRTQLLHNARNPAQTALIRIAARNELQLIAVEINRMLTEIAESNRRSSENQERLYRAELLQRKLQFSALQSQINPHFLYNTLACIRGIALENGQDEIASVTVKMAKIFRYSIKGDAYVQVREELGIIRRYLEIMNLRMSGKFHTEVDVPEEIARCWITKMVLQPIVENAVFHGLEGLSRDGQLSIRGRMESSAVYAIEICDNGMGIPPDRLEDMRRLLRPGAGDPGESVQDNGMGVGLLNINRKIQLLLGEDYGLQVDSAPGEGTKVTVYLPALRQHPN
jgi:two-component system sensor histidine kinase YesM